MTQARLETPVSRREALRAASVRSPGPHSSAGLTFPAPPRLSLAAPLPPVARR